MLMSSSQGETAQTESCSSVDSGEKFGELGIVENIPNENSDSAPTSTSTRSTPSEELVPPTTIPTSDSTVPPTTAVTVGELKAANQESSLSQAGGMTEDDRLEERRAKNRVSAHQSRLRKRRQLRYLQNQVLALTEENKKLKVTNQSLVTQLATTQAENTNLRLFQQEAARIASSLRIAQELPNLQLGAGRFPPFPPV